MLCLLSEKWRALSWKREKRLLLLCRLLHLLALLDYLRKRVDFAAARCRSSKRSRRGSCKRTRFALLRDHLRLVEIAQLNVEQQKTSQYKYDNYIFWMEWKRWKLTRYSRTGWSGLTIWPIVLILFCSLSFHSRACCCWCFYWRLKTDGHRRLKYGKLMYQLIDFVRRTLAPGFVDREAEFLKRHVA